MDDTCNVRHEVAEVLWSAALLRQWASGERRQPPGLINVLVVGDQGTAGIVMGIVKANRRGVFLTVMAVLLAVLAVSDFTKALQHLHDPHRLGIVIFGARFESVASNLILGPLMGLVLAAYAYGLWTLRSWVVPLSIAYAFYVPVNLVLFWYFQTGPEVPPVSFILIYLAVAFTGSIGTALYLGYHRDKLAPP